MAATAPRTACLSWRGMAEARHQRPKVCPSYREGFLFPFPFPNPHAQQEMGSLWRAGRFSPDPHPQLFLPHAVTCSCSLPQSHFGALCRASPLPPITAQLPAHWAQTELPHGCPRCHPGLGAQQGSPPPPGSPASSSAQRRAAPEGSHRSALSPWQARGIGIQRTS